jgi:hypothetical protein
LRRRRRRGASARAQVELNKRSIDPSRSIQLEAMPGTPAQMASFSRSERDRWSVLVNELGLKLD